MFKVNAVAFSCAIALTSAAFGQTWVSSTGNDSNTCTRTSPCATFQRAINLTGAWGEVHVVDAGQYGAATISEPMTIDGGGFATTLIGSGTAFSVNAPNGAVVQVRNLSIHGEGAAQTGISYNSGSQLIIENVKVNGFGGNCIVAGIAGSGTADLVIKDSSIDNCSSAGVYINNSETITVSILNSHVHFANLGVYAYVGHITISGSSFSSPGYGTNTWGIYLPTGGVATVLVDNSVFSGYAYAGYIVAGTLQLNRSTFTNNTTALIGGASATIISNGNNSFFNNGSIGTINQTVSLQ